MQLKMLNLQLLTLLIFYVMISNISGGFSFLGARIIDSVIDDLWRNRGFSTALNLTLAGSRYSLRIYKICLRVSWFFS